MTTQIIDLAAVREAGQLLTLPEALDILHTTEPLAETEFSLNGSDTVAFSVPKGWNDEIRYKPDDFQTECEIQINNSSPVALTKEAILKMTSSIGLTKDYVMRSPGQLTQANLNYWAKNEGVKGSEKMRLLSKDGVGLAFVKDSLSTFANLPVVEKAVDHVKEHFNTDEIYVDYKFTHSLRRTGMRLIVPSYKRTIHSARHTDEKPDDWSLGLQITNSLTGDPETRLNLSGYLFAWWCTNGAISMHGNSGNYNRRVQGQEFDEVLDWVGESVDTILAELEEDLDGVEALTEMDLEGELNDVVADVFKQLKVPVPARKGVIDALVDSGDLTAYGLMQAVTLAANAPDMTDTVAESTMRVGGILPHTLSDRCESCHRVVLH